MAKRKILVCCDCSPVSPQQRDFAEAGDSAVVQLRDVSKEHFKLAELKRTDMTISNPDKFLKKGDVLFKARGHVLKPIRLDINLHARLSQMASSCCGRRLRLPRYLAWVLNNMNFDRIAQQTHVIAAFQFVICVT